MIQACGRTKTDQDLRIFPLVLPQEISLGLRKFLRWLQHPGVAVLTAKQEPTGGQLPSLGKPQSVLQGYKQFISVHGTNKTLTQGPKDITRCSFDSYS